MANRFGEFHVRSNCRRTRAISKNHTDASTTLILLLAPSGEYSDDFVRLLAQRNSENLMHGLTRERG